MVNVGFEISHVIEEKKREKKNKKKQQNENTYTNINYNSIRFNGDNNR